MKPDGMFEDLTARLYAKNIQDLRQIAREVGVHRPADCKKDELISAIMAIANGKKAPVAHSVRGAPPKSREFDKQLVDEIKQCREYRISIGMGLEYPDEGESLSVSDNSDDGNCSGILEQGDKRWYIRVNGCNITAGRDVAVQESFITRFGLREGDRIAGEADKLPSEQFYGLKSVYTVNGFSPDGDEMTDRPNFSDFNCVYPDRQLFVSCGIHDITGRMTDFFTPVGAGQRAVISGPARTGKTQLLKSIGAGICRNCSESAVVALLLGARPEEADEIRRALVGGDIFTTGLEDGAFVHLHAASLALKFAKRQTELSNDVIFIVDGANLLVRDGDLSEIVKILAAAGNFGKSSLTVIAALEADVTERSKFNAVFAAANMEITLSADGALRRLFPAFDLKRCFSAKPELVTNREQIEVATKLRVSGSGSDGLYGVREHFLNTPDNAAITKKFKD